MPARPPQRLPVEQTPPRRRGRRDDRGGALSLWVVLMVPVAAFAAVVALAGPQRLAAESTVQAAADDLAAFAVAWRDGQHPEGPLAAFPPECEDRAADQQTEIAGIREDITSLGDSPTPEQVTTVRTRLEALHRASRYAPPSAPALNADDLTTQLNELVDKLGGWDDACELLFDALTRDLGRLGVDMNSVRGTYSDSLRASSLGGACSSPEHTNEVRCIAGGGAWTPDAAYALPCQTVAGDGTRRGAVVVHDAVHAALVVDWAHAGWAAAQVWPDGRPMAAESIGRLTTYQHGTAPEDCGEQVVAFDSQGRPIWASGNATPHSRALVQSVRRTPLLP